VVNRQVIFIVVGVVAVVIAVFFALGFMGTVKVDDEVKVKLYQNWIILPAIS
jgi:predicted RND superfamily exporter protein